MEKSSYEKYKMGMKECDVFEEEEGEEGEESETEEDAERMERRILWKERVSEDELEGGGDIGWNLDDKEEDEDESLDCNESVIPAMLEMSIAGGIAKKDFQYLKDFLDDFNVYPMTREKVRYSVDDDHNVEKGLRQEEDIRRITGKIARRYTKRSKEEVAETKARWEYQREMQVITCYA